MHKIAKAVAWLSLAVMLGCSSESDPPATAEASAPSVGRGDPGAVPTGGRLAEAMNTPEFLQACEVTSGCMEAAGPVARMESAWRIVVRRDAAGDLHIESVERIEVMADGGLPVGPVYGDYALVGLDGDGTVVDGQLLQFPAQSRLEFSDGRAPEVTDLSTSEVSALAYLAASSKIVTLQVRSRDGGVLDTAQPPAGIPTTWHNRLGDWLGIRSAQALDRPFMDMPPHCSHIVLLEGEQDRHLFVGSGWAGASLGWPGPYQLAAMRAALNRMTPLLCQSIGRIAFAYARNAPDSYAVVNSLGAGDLITINAASEMGEEWLEKLVSRRLLLQQTLAHEAGHTAETLLTVQGSGNDKPLDPMNYHGAWGLPARNLAEETIANVRLEAGLESEWRRLHESFVQQGWATQYGIFPIGTKAKPATWQPEDVVQGGFISRYASDNWAEDIGDTVGTLYWGEELGQAMKEHGVDRARQDYACLAFQQYTENNLPSKYAAVYAKMHFLQDLGLVHAEDVKTCQGDHLEVPIDGPGFHLWHKGEKRRVYDTALKAHIGTRQNGAPVFEMEAMGEAGFGDDTYTTQVKLRLDVGNRFQPFEKISWPRGVYPLGLAGDNNFTLRLDGAPAGNFDVMDGFALVAEASNQRIAGSVVIQRVFRLNAPLPVPEVYNPPLVVRFMIDK